MLRSLFAHPLTRKLDLDDPQTTILRNKIIEEKRFLQNVYSDWYTSLAAEIDHTSDRVLEIGSGAGFLSEHLPNLICSDVMLLPWISVVLDGARLPFQDQSLDGILMQNVLHHIKRIEEFFEETARCIRPDGKLVMIEPWVTNWSKFVYTLLHHEPIDIEAKKWELDSQNPLSSANIALPWIVFVRDRELFEKKYPMWEVSEIQLMNPLTYLLSGGVATRSLMPAWSYEFWRRLEQIIHPSFRQTAMFAKVVLQRK